jgi:DNA polymerase III epsilon subunit-like protein
MRFVLDVETNGVGGFRPPRQRIMQLAYGAWDDSTPLAVASVFVRGAGELSPKAFEVHGLSLAKCESEGIALGDAVRAMCASLASCDMIVGHNVEFDIGCILNQLETDGLVAERDEFARLTETIPVVCTMRTGTPVCKLPRRGAWSGGPGFKFPTLAELHTKLFGAPPDCRLHDAAADCEVTAKCLDRMIEGGK